MEGQELPAIMFVSCHEATAKNHNVQVANKSFENVDKVKVVWNDVNKPELRS